MRVQSWFLCFSLKYVNEICVSWIMKSWNFLHEFLIGPFPLFIVHLQLPHRPENTKICFASSCLAESGRPPPPPDWLSDQPVRGQHCIAGLALPCYQHLLCLCWIMFWRQCKWFDFRRWSWMRRKVSLQKENLMCLIWQRKTNQESLSCFCKPSVSYLSSIVTPAAPRQLLSVNFFVCTGKEFHGRKRMLFCLNFNQWSNKTI